MDDEVDLVIAPLDLADNTIATEFLAMQRAAYAVEAELIGMPDLPMLRETLPELQACGEEFLGASTPDGRLRGAVSWRVLDDGTVDIYRLVVDPAAHRRGIATTLLDVLAATVPTSRTIVSTGSANAPALALYRRHGFREAGEREVEHGVRLTDLERDGIS